LQASQAPTAVCWGWCPTPKTMWPIARAASMVHLFFPPSAKCLGDPY